MGSLANRLRIGTRSQPASLPATSRQVHNSIYVFHSSFPNTSKATYEDERYSTLPSNRILQILAHCYKVRMVYCANEHVQTLLYRHLGIPCPIL
jgi:hypothetical protein